MGRKVVGIDLGGTTIKGVVLNEYGENTFPLRMPTDAHIGGIAVLENIMQLIQKLIDSEGSANSIAAIGLGTPGFIDSKGKVLGGAENINGWEGMQIYSPILEKFGLPVFASNDVTVMTLAESRFGAGRGIKNCVCFALGTGVGGGLVINGKLYDGTQGMAGELGHIVVETNGIPCSCGQNGCVEQYASSSGIVNIARKYCENADAVIKTDFVNAMLASPRELTPKMVYEYVNLNDPVALLVNDTVCDMLARAVGITANILSPDRVILGGGVMMAGQVIVDTVSKYAGKYCWKSIRDRFDIRMALLGEDAGVIGAAVLAMDKISSSDYFAGGK